MDVSDNLLEQLFIVVTCENRKICIGVIYISPELADDSNNIEQHIKSSLTILTMLDPHDFFLMFGDYNQPGVRWKSAPSGHAYPDPVDSTFSTASSALLDGMSLANMKQMSVVTNTRNCTLDLLFVTDDAVANYHVSEALEPLVVFDVHHPPLSAEIS